MKISIPVIEDNGLDSVVSEHFGRAPFHMAVDVDSLETYVFKKENECSEEDHGHCLPVDLLIENQIKVVACKGIGRGAVARIRQLGIPLFATKSDTVRGVIEELNSQMLIPVNNEHICQGHGDHHHH